MRPLAICEVTAEAAPFAKTGGLGDAVAGLTRMLGAAGQDVRLFLPLYPAIWRQGHDLVPVDFLRDVTIWLGTRELRFSAYTTPLPASDVAVYFLHCPALFHQDGIYTAGWDEHYRFAFLSVAALTCCQRMGWAPDILHVHDWHAALTPLYARTLFAWDRLFAATRSVLTLHNLGHHGVFGGHTIGELGLEPYRGLLPPEDLAADQLSFLKNGIRQADLLTTVSETYAREILTPEGGFGLDGLLRERAASLVGIVNGIDYGDWDPRHDPHLPHHYGATDLAGKARMKRALLERVGMEAGDDVPVVGMVSRLVEQKGIDLCFESLPAQLGRHDFRLVVLGSGEPRYEAFFHALQATFPGRVWFYRGYHEPLAHWIEAGADIFLMPSRYEPCGLNQLYSLRYGTPPVVRRTGGLADTVEPYSWEAGTGTGFVFADYTAAGLAWALDYALTTFAHPEAWRGLQRRGMALDFSWERQGRAYLELFRNLAGGA
ncbi:MAG TPA: glycogen synthase [Thermoanaerobaculia bacterium]|nr:glycogen synthase [Thermoanaerobaculia bacterium]